MNLLNNPKKLFLILIIIGVVLLATLSHFALTPLYDGALEPQAASEQYRQFNNYYTKATLLIYVLLIFIANAVYRASQKGIYLFYGWLFFSVFILFSYIYMAEEYFHFKQRAGLWQGEFSVAGFAGMLMCLVAATAAFINYIVLNRMAKK